MKPNCLFTPLEWWYIILPLNSTRILWNNTNSHSAKTTLTIPKKRQRTTISPNHITWGGGGHGTQRLTHLLGGKGRQVWLIVRQLPKSCLVRWCWCASGFSCEQSAWHFTSREHWCIILTLNSIHIPWNRTNFLKNLHRQQLTTPERRPSIKPPIAKSSKDAPKTFKEKLRCCWCLTEFHMRLYPITFYRTSRITFSLGRQAKRL